MKNWHQFTSLIVLATFSLTAVGCSGDGGNGATGDESAVTSSKYTGEQLFRGVFLGEGEVARERLADIWHGKTLVDHLDSLTPAQIAQAKVELTRLGHEEQIQYLTELSGAENKQDKAAARALKARFLSGAITTIAQEDPEFFQRFAADVQSGDHLRVMAAFNEGSMKLRQSVGYDSRSGYSAVRCHDCWIDVSVGAYAIIVVVAFAIVAAALVIAPAPTKDGSTIESLSKDILVNKFTETLAVERL